MNLRRATSAAIVAVTCLAAPGRARGDEASPSAPPTTTAGVEPTAAATEPVGPATASKRTLWPWVIMGTGVALIVTATVLEISSFGEEKKGDDLEVKLTGLPPSDPARAPIAVSIADHKDSASNERTAALIVGTVGFLAVAGSVVLWFFEGRSSSSSPPAAKRGPSLTPSFGPTYAGASLGASF